MEFHQTISRFLRTCCSGYSHPPKFWGALISEPPLKSLTWWLRTLGFSPWARVSLYICLACSLHSSFCMLMYKSCLRPCSGYAQSLHSVCACCVRYQRICCTHTRSHIHCRTSIVSINEQSITSVVLVTHIIGQSCWTCVSGWFGHFLIKSCECVFLWSPMHLSIVHTLSHFC